MSNPNTAKSLYNALVNKGYTATELGDEDTFVTAMGDENNRKELYDMVTTDGYDIGEYDAFNARFQPTQPQRPNLAERARPNVDTQTATPMMAPAISDQPAKSDTIRPVAPIQAPRTMASNNQIPSADEEYAVGLGQGLEQGWKGLKEGVRFFAGETANLFTGSTEDEQRALDLIDSLESAGVKDIAEATKPLSRKQEKIYNIVLGYEGVPLKEEQEEIKRLLGTNDVNKTISEAIQEAGGDITKAKRALQERASKKTWGDRIKEDASQEMSKIKPTKGFGAWVGNLIPQMIPSAAAIALSTITKNPKYLKMVGGIGMGTMTASTVGQSMKEARDAGASNGEVWATGIADGFIEYITEKLPFDNYTKRLFNGTKKKVGKELAEAVADPQSPARNELENLLSQANKKLGGKLISSQNAKDYVSDMLAEGASEFVAEAVQTITPMIYEDPEDYPTLSEILLNGYEGWKAGIFMGSVLGGASKIAEHKQNRNRRKQQGYVDVAQVVLPEEGVSEVGEIITQDPDTKKYTVLVDGNVMQVPAENITTRYKFSFDEFDNGVLQMEQDESFDNGYTLETPQEKNDAQNMFEYQQQQVRNFFGLGEDGDIDSYLGDDVSVAIQRVGMGDAKAEQLIKDYFEAKATRAGVIQRVNDNIENRVAESDAAIDRNANTDNGTIQPVTLKNDKKAHVVSGKVVLTEDGTMVNTRESSESIIIRDDETGKVDFTTPSNILEAGTPIDAAAEKEAMREKITNEETDKALNELNGVLPFNVGDTYTLTDDEGVQHTAKIVADNGDGTIAMLYDNETELTVATKAMVQEMSDVTNQLRLGEYLEGKQAAEIAMEEQEQPNIPIAEQQEVAEEQPVSALSLVPKNDKGKLDFEQVSPDIAWRAIVELNDGGVNDALDSAKQMLKMKQNALEAAKKEKPKVGVDIEAIVANKKAHNEKVAQLQAIADHWANIVNMGEQATAPQQQEAVAPEVAPVAEEQPMAEQEVVEQTEEQTPIEESVAVEDNTGLIGRSLTSEEAKSVINTMQQNAEQVELMELTPENWIAQFGEDGVLETPIGEVKMGENQYFKLAQKGRDGKLGMIKPTLLNPDVIIEEKSAAKKGQPAERESSYVFVKAFTNDDGSRNYLFTSVTIRKEGKEVVISNQEKETPRIERLLKEGKLAYISKATLPSESTNSTQGNQSTVLGGAILSESKDTTTEPKKQEIEQENLQPTPENIAENQAEPRKISLEQYLGELGLSQPLSDYMLDKQKLPNLRTEKARKKFEQDAAVSAKEYSQRRESARTEYFNLVENGKIIPLSDIDRLLVAARGHEDLGSTQAARRSLEKRGIDWLTGDIIKTIESSQLDSEAVEPTSRGVVDMDTLQLTMSDEEFNSLLESGDVERMNVYLKELDDTLVVNDQSPFKGQQELREEFKRLKDQYGGKDNIPTDVMEDINARYKPYAELSQKVYDRKYALEDRLRSAEVQAAQTAKKEENEVKETHQVTAFNGFLADKTKLGASNAEQALSKKVKIEGNNYTIAEYVEQAVQSGKIELRTSEVPKYKGVSRRKWNQMDAAQQQAEQERIKNGGTVTEYYINDYNLGKTAYDYAQYLQAKAEAQKAAEPEWLQKVPTDGRNFMVYTKVAGENNYSATDLKTGQAVGLVYASLVKRDRLQSLVEELPKVLLEGTHFQIRDTKGKIYYSSEPIETTKGKKKATTKMTTLKTVSGAEVKVPINLYKYVSTDKTRAYTGVYFDPEGFVVATDGHNMIAVKHDVAEADAEKFISKAGDVASTIFNWRIANPKPNTEKPMNVDFVDVEKQIGGKAGDKFVVFEIDGQEVGFPPKAIHVLADFQRAFGGQAFVGDMTAGKAIVIRSGDNYAIALQTTKYADLSQAIHIPSGIEQTTEQVEQPAAVSEQAQQPTEPTKQEPKPKRTADRKIEDYGEKIAGARKDILRNMSKNFDNATIESLIALPFAKAFVKPDLKKLVEAGVLRPDDAKYAEAIMWVYINKNKPKARKTDVWAAKRGRETRITAWAKKTFDGITRLRDFIEADEATRDELIAQYGQLGEQIKAEENAYRNSKVGQFNAAANGYGDLYSPNPIEVIVAALDKLNYQAGDKITFDAPIVKAEYLGRFYNFENQDGEKVYAFNRADSIEEAIDTLVLQAKIRRGDTDIQYPTYMFSITREDPIREPSGMFTVFHINKRGSLIPETVEGREAAEKKVAEYQSQGLSADLREEKKIVGYATHRIRFKNRLTDVETIFDEKFGSEGDARQALEERYDEFNDLANDYVASLSKQKREQPVPFEVTTSWNSETKAVKYVVKNTETGDVMSPQLDTRKEAEEYYKNHIEEWKAKWQEMKDARKKFVFFDDNVKPREGKDYRNGRDVTAEDLATTFGFRGIQFGNWTNDADRQAALNQAYDAFMDLTDILGVSPKALSLAGELGIAFGARGGGSALAHYEPDEIVINLTKTKGAGSLAHEWWHALDNYFSRQGNIPMGFVTSNPAEAKMREEMRAAWQGVVKAVKGTEYAKRSMAQGDYWGRMLEMTARLFGEWTVYELAKTGRTNHFLSRGITPSTFDLMRRINYEGYKWSLPEDQTPMSFEEFALLPRSLKGMPFPTKEETEQMGEAVRNLFDVVQEKVDEQGNVVLFQRGDFPEMPNTEANRRAYNLVREKLQNAGIKVHEVSEEMARQMAEAVGGSEFQLVQRALSSLDKASKTIARWLKNNERGKSFEITLPESAKRKVRKAMGRDFDSHNITADGIVHALKNHGEGGKKLNEKSIPIRKEDAELIPYIMVAPDFVKKGSTKNNRESVRYYKNLSNGYVVVIEKELDNSVDDLETINMWAELSDVSNAQRTLNRTSETPTIGRSDAAKIRKDAEIAIQNDAKLPEFQIVYHGSGAAFDRFDHSFMGSGEGAQAYGWGTYVTQVEGIGRSYSKSTSKGEVLINGKPISKVLEDQEIWDPVWANWINRYARDAAEMSSYILSAYIDGRVASPRSVRVRQFQQQKQRLLEMLDNGDFTFPPSYLYSVDIPDSNGEYLQWDKNVSKYVRKKLIESVTEGNFGFWVPDHLREASREARAEYWLKEAYPDNPHSGEAVYNLLSVVMGSDRAASAYLRDNGFIGIEYPAQYQSGGRADNAKNYVIFNENDLKIVDRIELFQDAEGKIYGWAVGGEIYLTPDGLNANTAIHEYSHLWVEALREKDPRKWSNIKEQLKVTPFWQQVLDDPNYANIRENEDAVASEVLARLSGNKGAERLTNEAQRIIDAGNGNLMARVESSALVQHVKRLLRDFYAWVSRNIFGITNEATISRISDMVVDDLVNEETLEQTEDSPFEAQIADGTNYTEEEQQIIAEVVANFDADFAELESEYQQLDQNDAQAMTEWRAKKKQVVEDYLGYMTEDLAFPATVYVYDHNDKESLDGAVRYVAEAVARKFGEDVEELYLPENKDALDELRNNLATSTAIGAMTNGAGRYNVGRGEKYNKPTNWLNAVSHENTHYLVEDTHTEQEFEAIWNEAVENEAPIVEIIQEKYADDTDAKKGEEVVAYAIGDYAGSMHTDKFVSFIKGENQISLADITSKLNKSLPLRNEIVIEVLNKLRDGYQRREAETEVKIDRGNNEANREREAEGQDQARGERSPRRDSQAAGRLGYNLTTAISEAETLAEKLGTPIRVVRDVTEITDERPYAQARKRASKGWYDVNTGEVVIVAPNIESEQDAKETILHEVVGHKGLRGIVGDEVFNAFLDNVFRNASPETRAKIVDLSRKYGWDFRLATEEYIASLAESGFNERENRSFWDMVRDFFRDMLSKAKIALGYDINDNDLRYMLWRSYQMQTSKGAMAVAEDVVVQQKLGVGDFRTRQRVDKDGNPIGDGSYHSPYRIDDTVLSYPNVEYRVNKSSTTESVYVTYYNTDPKYEWWEQPKVTVRFSNHGNNATEFGNQIWGGVGESKYQTNVILARLGLKKPIPVYGASVPTRMVSNADIVSGKYEVADITKSELLSLPIWTDISEYQGKLIRGTRELVLADKVLQGRVRGYEFEDIPEVEARRTSQSADAPSNVDDLRFRSVGTQTASEANDATEEIDNYDAGSMTFEESITNGLVTLAKENRENAELKMQAIHSIGGNLAKLRRAMRAQRKYDKAAIDSIIRIAKMAMNSGFFTDMSRSEITRLLNLVNAAASSRDITNQARLVVDMLLKHQVKEAKNIFEKLLKVRGSKVDNRGIVTQGKLDVDGQKMLATFKEAIKLDAKDLQEKINQALDEMGSDDNIVAANATVQYQGLMLAKQYADEIKESEIEETEIKTEIASAKDAKLLSGGDLREYIESAEDAIRDNRLERIEAYRRMIAALGEGLNYSIVKAKEWREQQQERVQEIQHDANRDLQGIPADEHVEIKHSKEWVNNGVLQFFMQPLATFSEMLKYFGSKSADGKGFLYNRFMPALLKASDTEWKNSKAAKDELSNKLSEIMGKKMRIEDVFSMMRKMPTMTVEFMDGKEKKTFELPQGNLLYIYMVNKMNDGRMKLRNMGISEEDVAEIVKNIDPRFIEFADWVQSDFLNRKRNDYNEVHKRMFGASMSAIENYFPLIINERSITKVENVEEHSDNKARPSTITGSIIKRKRNAKPIDIINADAFNVVLDHIDQMEHWAAYAEFNRDLNALLSYKRFRNKVFNMSSARFGAGSELWKNFKNTAAIAAGVYQPQRSKADALLLNVAKGVTASKISFRLWTALKQILSLPAFAADTDVVGLAKAVAKNPATTWNWALDNLPTFAKRWQSRQAGDNRLRKTDLDWGIFRDKAAEAAIRVGMTPNAFVDALTCVIGARAVYETKRAKYLKQGYSESKAEEKALFDASVAFNETQQSSESAFLSPIQEDRTVTSVGLTVFRNSNMAFARRVFTSLADLKNRMRRGHKEESIERTKRQKMLEGLTEAQATKAATNEYNRQSLRNIVNLLVFGFVNKFLWELGSNAIYLLFGDDDDEKERMLEDAAMISLAGPIEGLTGGDIAIEMLAMKLSGKNFYGYSFGSLPAMDDIQNVLSKFQSDKVAAANDVLNILISAGFGVNLQTLTDMVVAIVDAAEGDLDTSKEIALLLMRLAQVPQSQIDKLYIDELGINGQEAQEMDVEEMAKRYAKYKRMRSAPITGFLYDEEGIEKAEKKHQKRFNKMVKERIKEDDDSLE